jgi:TPR repeat protein
VAQPPPAVSANEGLAALAKGDVAEARREFRRLADRGMAEAALALGSTYDPINADHVGLASAEADPEQTKHWYRRAIELTREASKRRGAP